MNEVLQNFDNIIKFHFIDYRYHYMLIGTIVLFFLSLLVISLWSRKENCVCHTFGDTLTGVFWICVLYDLMIFLLGTIFRYAFYLAFVVCIFFIISLVITYIRIKSNPKAYTNNSLWELCEDFFSPFITWTIFVSLFIWGVYSLSTFCIELFYKSELKTKYSQNLIPEDIDLDKLTVHVEISSKQLNNHNVGHEWRKKYYINGTRVKDGSTITINTSKPVRIETEIEELDVVPDVSYETSTITPSYLDLLDGVKYAEYSTVFENRGRYSGKTSEWQTTYELKLDIPDKISWTYALPFCNVKYKSTKQ